MRPRPKDNRWTKDLQIRIGKVLRKKRKALELSSEDFADMLDVHRTYYSKLELGQKNLSLAALQKLAWQHGIRVAVLIDDAEMGRF